MVTSKSFRLLGWLANIGAIDRVRCFIMRFAISDQPILLAQQRGESPRCYRLTIYSDGT